NPENMVIQTAQGPVLADLSKAGEYMLMVEDFNGCTTSITIALEDVEGCLEARSVITPNGDGKNENFIIRCVEAYKDTRLEVYSRWGHLVYAEDAYSSAWAGQSLDGSIVPDGVYYYVLIYTDFGGEQQQQQGTITVLTE
ncbi:MAG: gliding motility-associated C-terminal domain-containing protein, partial [Bacteroidota bacterium]